MPLPVLARRPSALHLVLAQLRRYENSVLLPVRICEVSARVRFNLIATAFSISLKWADPPKSFRTSTTTGASSAGEGNLAI